MKTSRCILIIALLVAGGCRAEVVPDPYASPPTRVGDPVVTDAIEPIGEASPAPQAPSVTDTCVEYQTARAIVDEQERHHDWLEREAAAANGWERLTEFAPVMIDPGKPDEPYLYGIEIRKMLPDRFIDGDGQHWLFVDSSNGCSDFDTALYIDGRANVFAVESSAQCEVEEMASCGDWPEDGCGTEPDDITRVYVRVPKRARLLEGSVPLTFPAERCYHFEPEGGYALPA